MELCDDVGLRTYIPEPKMPKGRVWTDKRALQQWFVYTNRRRLKPARGRGSAVSGANKWNVRSRISATRAACAARGCEDSST